MLNLLEAHGLVCDIGHHITHCHYPIADVILTKCIFNHVVLKIRPIHLYKLSGNYRKRCIIVWILKGLYVPMSFLWRAMMIVPNTLLVSFSCVQDSEVTLENT